MNGKYLEPKPVYLRTDIDKEQRKKYEKMGYDALVGYILPGKFVDRFTTLVQVLKEFTDQTNVGEKFNICEELDFEIKRLLQSLVYLSNSTSFEKGDKYYEFDRKEINRKLGRKKGD